jgi:hypothetical protein
VKTTTGNASRGTAVMPPASAPSPSAVPAQQPTPTQQLVPLFQIVNPGDMDPITVDQLPFDISGTTAGGTSLMYYQIDGGTPEPIVLVPPAKFPASARTWSFTLTRDDLPGPGDYELTIVEIINGVLVPHTVTIHCTV